MEEEDQMSEMSMNTMESKTTQTQFILPSDRLDVTSASSNVNFVLSSGFWTTIKIQRKNIPLWVIYV